uniref:DDE-1 domain-containing protein n=1 Tax=Pelodiscus sinensis TaxID=13735 RepID=K7GJR5_PELSI
PMTVYRSANPRALAGYSKNHIPVVWRSNAKAWVTASIFTDYFCHRLTTELKDYCLQENLAFKILLLLDNAPGHPPCLTDLSENIQVLFSPPNTTSLIQPLDQEAIAAFKVYYLRHTFARLITETDGKNKQFWRTFNVKDAIDIIVEAWAEVSSSCLSSVLHCIRPACVHKFREFDTEIAEAKTQIVTLAHEAGLEEVDATDVQRLLDSHGEELFVDELNLLDEQKLENEPEHAEPVIQTLLMKVMAEAFKLISDAINIFDENDPDHKWNSKVVKSLESTISYDQQLYNEKQKAAKQLSIKSFF